MERLKERRRMACYCTTRARLSSAKRGSFLGRKLDLRGTLMRQRDGMERRDRLYFVPDSAPPPFRIRRRTEELLGYEVARLQPCVPVSLENGTRNRVPALDYANSIVLSIGHPLIASWIGCDRKRTLEHPGDGRLFEAHRLDNDIRPFAGGSFGGTGFGPVKLVGKHRQLEINRDYDASLTFMLDLEASWNIVVKAVSSDEGKSRSAGSLL